MSHEITKCSDCTPPYISGCSVEWLPLGRELGAEGGCQVVRAVPFPTRVYAAPLNEGAGMEHG